MRKIIDFAPSFFFNLHKQSNLVNEYHRKYNAIDTLLDENPSILKHIHSDLKRLGTNTGRGSSISSEQVLRSIIVMYIEQCPYRETVIRISDSDFLRNFTRIGIGKVLSFGYLCQAHKLISATTWAKINIILQSAATKKEKISGENYVWTVRFQKPISTIRPIRIFSGTATVSAPALSGSVPKPNLIGIAVMLTRECIEKSFSGHL